MSEIRLVRCPKCNKVLPEPSNVTVYQCGACGALLRSKKLTLGGGLSEGSEKLGNSDKGREREEEVGGLMEGSFDQESVFDVGNRSPARSQFGDGIGSKSPIKESHLNELNGDSPKLSMEDKFFGDNASVLEDLDSSVRPRNTSSSPMRERGSSDFDFDGAGKSTWSLRNASKSPLRREMGGQTPVSVRSRHVSRSPMRDPNGVRKSPARSTIGDLPNSPMRGDHVSKFDENVEGGERGVGEEQEARGRKMTPKTSFTTWLPDDKATEQSDVNYPGRRRTWRDRLGDGVDQVSEGRDSIHGSDYGMTSEGSVDDLIQGFDPNKEIMHRDVRFRNDNVREYGKSRGSIDQWVTGRHGVGVEHGHSNYRPDSIYGYDDQRHNFDTLRGPASVQDLELERAELLRKYNELKDQLSDLDDKRVSSPGLYRGADDYSEDESWRFRQESLRQFALGKTVGRPPHFNHDALPVHDMGDLYNYHPPQYDDPFSGQAARLPHHKPQHQFLKRQIPGHFPGRSLDFDQDSLRSYNDLVPSHIPGRSLDFDRESLNSYLDDTHYHHPACSCSLCLADGISVNSAPNPRVGRYVPRVYNPRMAQTNPRERPSLLAHGHPRRTPVTALNKRLCHPIAGGSPFVLCCKCFRLLKLPGKLMQKNQEQLQCGACSSIISFDLQTRSFGLCPSQQKLNSDGSDSRIGKVLKESVPKHHREMTATSTNFGSYDFDAESSVISKGRRQSSSSADNLHHLSPSPSHNSRSSKEDCNSDTASVRSTLPTSTEKLLINLVRPPPGSALEDHMQYSNIFRKLQAEGTKSNDGEEKDTLQKDTSLEGSLENAAIATKAKVHPHKLSSTQDPGEEEDKAANSKDKHSSIAGFVKWGFASKSGRPSPGKAEVYVNGQPISHRVVKRAEKFAGPIEPGEYWYDSKAGFWGVMGHRCLGIIPPSIQEFSFPMPTNCSGGDTTIYANGRELHKRDMDLLSSRGLPKTSNKSYIIDISGKVVEEETREFIVNLGKLAPSVERKRCGYGMQVPEKLED